MQSSQKILRSSFLTVLTLAITSCAQTQAIRMSGDTMMIQTSGAAACGVQGSMKVAEKMAAIETLRAGYERYQILTGGTQNSGSTFMNGTNDVALNVKMFKKGEHGYKNAISAKEVLGPDWQKLVASGVNTCS